MEEQKLSFAYRFLRNLGLNFPLEEYGHISFHAVVFRFLKTLRDAFLISFFMDCWIFAPVQPRKLRPWCLKLIGCKVGKNVFIGSDVWIDSGHANLITIGDRSHVDARCILLCHKRNLDDYCVGDDYHKLRYKVAPISIGCGCSIGTASIIMPGVTIGEGAIVGAGSLVTKDIPAWTIATGRPAKVVKEIPKREI